MMMMIVIIINANIVSHLSSEFFQFAAQSSVAPSVSLRNLYRDDDDDDDDDYAAVDDDCDDGEDDYEDII